MANEALPQLSPSWFGTSLARIFLWQQWLSIKSLAPAAIEHHATTHPWNTNPEAEDVKAR